jgi:hypothetical protein
MTRLRRFAACSLLLVVSACGARPTNWLGSVSHVAPGVDLYQSFDPSLVDGAGPVALSLIKIDPAQARISSALSNERVLDAETVVEIAKRRGALAAINGGFFNRDNGEPIGLLKVGGELVSDASAPRGVVVIGRTPDGRDTLTFDQLAAKVTMHVKTTDEEWEVPIAGVDTTRERGKVMLYTPAYHGDTDTAPTGTEWVLSGQPLTVTEIRRAAGRTPIPPQGAVLSFGGTKPPDELEALEVGALVTFATEWRSRFGVPPAVLDASTDIINGAGLIRRGGQSLNDWKVEALPVATFVEARHPRTLIGQDRQGAIWLIAVDGRQPDHSVGMTFADLERLAGRLELIDALNLDGGGSTTMVVRGRVVNRPSDPGGRPVADAVIVTPRQAP